MIFDAQEKEEATYEDASMVVLVISMTYWFLFTPYVMGNNVERKECPPIVYLIKYYSHYLQGVNFCYVAH